MAALSVEPAYASLTVEPACAFNLLIGWGGLMVEHLKVLISRAPCRVLALGSASPSGSLLF